MVQLAADYAPLPTGADDDPKVASNLSTSGRDGRDSRPLSVSTPTTTTSPASTPFHLVAPDTVLTPESLVDEDESLGAHKAGTGCSDNWNLVDLARSTARTRTGTRTSTDIQDPSDAPVAAPAAASGKPNHNSAFSASSVSVSSTAGHLAPRQHPPLIMSDPAANAPAYSAPASTRPSAEASHSNAVATHVTDARAPPASIDGVAAAADSNHEHHQHHHQHQHQRRRHPHHHGSAISEGLISAPAAASPHNQAGVDKPHPQPMNKDSVASDTGSPSAPGPNSNATTNLGSPLTEEFPPLHTSTVLPETKIVHPKPITLPASSPSTPLPLPLSSVSLPNKRHSHHYHPHHQHLPDQNIRSSAFVDNVAQLEATAERLSTGTSSIGDAIRDLHGELKRSDSRRSSALAAHLKASQEDSTASGPPSVVGQLKRHLSNSSSIVSTNIAARHGGYSPAGFVMSPNHSLTGRLRSGSKNSTGRPDFDVEPLMSRHGPGKASVRSVRSHKMSLAEISESEPVSLTKDALDAADAAPPIEDDPDHDDHDDTIRPGEHTDNNGDGSSEEPHHYVHDQQSAPQHNMYSGSQEPNDSADAQYTGGPKPTRSDSVNTYQQAQSAFVDFDGVHWQPDFEIAPTPEPPSDMPMPMPAAYMPDFATSTHLNLGLDPFQPQPQPYTDPETGQQMVYYPVRVPAMLNLPPKLSNKPKAAQRNNRRSQVLSAMGDANRESQMLESKRKSTMPESNRDSFLPDPLAGQRGSFIALSNDGGWFGDEEQKSVVQQPDDEAGPSSPLRRPQRLSRTDDENRKSRMPQMDHLPPQLRASAFFDMPSTAPDVEVKDGSAMATLDSMLDASMNAPVSAFTGQKKEKKHKSKMSTASSQRPESSSKESKSRLSRFWFKRSHSHGSDDKAEGKHSRTPSALGDVHADTDIPETQALAASVDGRSSRDRDDEDAESDEEEDDDLIDGQPSTLLAELQLRKQQQKQRTQRPNQGLSNGMHATLLEMDTIAETQRKQRQNKRVNLAWEDPNAHQDQNGSDDEDVPLAIIAAKQQGAKNMADLHRPIGLMERRELEDNEPLSQRRARLQGGNVPITSMPPAQNRQSVLNLSAHLGGHVRNPSSLPRSPPRTPEPEEPEIEEETLADRKRRLEAKELPQARPVSSSFSAELLSQFGDLDVGKDKEAKDNLAPSPRGDEEEETLGQRRRRLQAEKEAREQEMNHGNLAGQQTPVLNKRLSMADVLSAHPKREIDSKAQAERQRIEQEHLMARDRDAKMAAMRMQMPTSLSGPTLERAGGFRGGLYNDGTGGFGLQPARSTSALYTQGIGQRPAYNRSSTALSAYGLPMQQPGYAPGTNMGTGYNPMAAGPYARSSMQLPMQMDMQPQMSSSSINRVEQWRHGVMP